MVGLIGRRSDDVSFLINRILDANIFGSGNLDRNLHPHLDSEAKKSWFRNRRISYFYDEEKGIVFLQFTSPRSPLLDHSSSSSFNGTTDAGLDSILEEEDSSDLRGLLLMFSICHVVIYLNEGSHFDTKILKKFRMLQAAKHSLVPYVKSHIASTLTSKASSHSTVQTTSSNISPIRGGAIMNRHSSAISLMSGSGSYPSLFPGQCTPVILFVFHDEFLDSPVPVSPMEDMVDGSSMSQSSCLSGILRPSMPPTKGSSSVVMLSRPMSKTEGSFRKKLQSSLEAQIRFLIKKCRTLAGTEANHPVSRGVVNVSSSPLFSLDASRAVTLLDKTTNHGAESLDFVMGIVEEVLNANVTSHVLLENHSQSAQKEDIQSIKEFIHRQSDTLRGRGGLAANANSGSAAGVGMVAVAAAAAAASAASGKPFGTPPELPTFENWLSCSQLILDVLLSAKRGFVDQNGISGKTSLRRNATATESDPLTRTDAIQAAISWLESDRGLNMKFSTSWCQRTLPAAKEIYLKDLPPCYPTSQHEAQLAKALRSFKSMAKGPALQMFAEKLEDECTSIWKSGRQLCDAVSLTGKPCVHQRHSVERSHSIPETDVKPHSSGYVFLHACACGRSRQLRDDPFDFDSANIKFNCFPNCENLLPSLQLPKFNNAEHLMSSSWSLVRVGGARYYEPTKGLLQSGFCSNEKFLLKWTILLEKCRGTDDLPVSLTHKRFIGRSTEPKVVSVTDEEIKKTVSSQMFSAVVQTGGLQNQRSPSTNVSSNDAKISFGTGLGHLALRKPFAEVVAGTVASDSAFPPLQQRKQSTSGLEKVIKQRVGRDQIEDQMNVPGDYQGSSKYANVSVQENSHIKGTNSNTDVDPFLRIGSNVVPVNVNPCGDIKPDTSLKHVVVYFGFEHECSSGHRFLLSPKHLNELGSFYSSSEESNSHSSAESSDAKVENSLNLHKNGFHGKVHLSSSGARTSVLNKVRAANKSDERVANRRQHRDGPTPFYLSGKEDNQFTSGSSVHSKYVKDWEGSLHCATLADDECAFPLLNRNIPIYMNCPYCMVSKKKDKIKFASTVSQLQRIFLVTPPFPVVIAACPIVQFEVSCLPPLVPDRERQSQFSLGCHVILPPESFVSLRLPFIYGVQLEDRTLQPLHHLEHQPQLTAWITKGTTLQIVSKGNIDDEEFHV